MSARADLQAVFAHLRSGEQRPATILMTDISGFSGLSEAADPEWVYHLINELFGELVECLVAHGAHIDKYVGDEIVALFGVPIAQEHSVERAVRAALALRERLAELNAEDRFGGLRLGLHTGINVGPVMVGPVGHRSHADYTVIGDTVNVAKRLEEDAPDGEIHVTRAVCDALAGEFEFQSVGLVSLGGRIQDVEVFRVLQAAPAAELRRHHKEVDLVARDRELAALAEAAGRALAGARSAIQVVGSAGTGKSRLIDEWCQSELAREFRVIRTSCHAFSLHFPLLPVVELAAAPLCLRVAGWPPKIVGNEGRLPEGLVMDERHAKTLQLLLNAYGPRTEHQDETWRAEVPECVRALVAALAAERPLCIVIEDIQWLDEASSAALAHALGAAGDRRLLVIVSAREPVDGAFPDQLGPELVALQALPPAAMKQLVSAWAAPDTLPDGTVSAICDRAQGHPYFARELVRALRGGAPSWGEDRSLPHTLQELFLSLLDRLPTDVRRVVQAASALGEPLSTPLLDAAMSADGALPPNALADATERGLLRAAPAAGQYVYGPRLLFEAAYTTIPTTRRRAVHVRIAEFIIGHLPELGPAAVHSAAHHAYLGYADERAIAPLIRSADRYHLEYACRQAIQDAHRAMELIASSGSPESFVEQRVEALRIVAQACTVLGDTGSAEGALAEAEVLTEYCDNPHLVGRIALSSATVQMMRGEHDAAAVRFDRAARVWAELGDETRVAHAMLGMGMCAIAAGDSARALELLAQAADNGAAAPWVRAAAWNNAGTVMLHTGRYRDAEGHLRRALTANEREGDRRGIAHTRASLGELAYRMATLDEAAAHLREALEIATAIEDLYCRQLAGLLLARVHGLRDGEEEAAEAVLSASPEAADDPELRAIRSLVELELGLTAEPHEGPSSDDAAPHAVSAVCSNANSAVCSNANAERLCVAIEQAIREDDRERLSALQEGLMEHLGSIPDKHLRRYAGWLSTRAIGANDALPPDPDGETTVFDLRARRVHRPERTDS